MNRFNNSAWSRLLKQCGISKFRWHDCRHTFASKLVQAGVSLAVIKELLGHGNIAITTRYAHLAQSNLRDAVRTIDRSPAEPGRQDAPMTAEPPTQALGAPSLLPIVEVARYLSLEPTALDALLAPANESPLARMLRAVRVELAPGLVYVRREEFLAGLRALLGAA